MDPEAFERMQATPTGSSEPTWTEAEFIDPDEQALIDIQEAIHILSSLKTMLDYISDKDLCSSISKRERQVIFKQSERVRMFLGNVVPTYIEE